MIITTVYTPQVTLTSPPVEVVEVSTTIREILEVSERGLNGIQGLQGLRGDTGASGPTGPTGNSEARRYTSGSSVSGHIAVSLDTAGNAVTADCTVAKSANAVMGITEGAALQDTTVVVLSAGSLEHAGWSFTPDMPVFLGLAGAITQTVPAEALFSKMLGIAVTATRISIQIQPAIFR